MLNRLARPLSALLLLCAPLACVTADPVIEEVCREGVCLTAAADVQASSVAPADEACVPAEPETYENDPSGLAISSVSLGDDGASLSVGFVNTNALGVYSYPGTLVRVVEGDAQVFLDMWGTQSEPNAEAVWQLYGIEACGAEAHTYGIAWGAEASVVLVAAAFDSLGEVVIDEVTFVVSRP